jgi:signal transduction histidine kinase
MFKIESPKRIAARLNRKFERSIRDFNPPFTTFAILGLIYYSLFYFPWLLPLETNSAAEKESFILRLIAIFLCFGLLARKKWPKKAQNWLPAYWYITLTYCLPFFFTFMFLQDTDAALRLMAFSSIIFWLVLLVDLTSAFILLFMGIAAAVGAFLLEKGFCPTITAYIFNVSAVYIVFLILIAFLVKNKKRLETEKKLRTAEAVGSGIAHELRTPLSAIIMGIEGAKKYFPTLIDAYQLARQNNLDGVKYIPFKRFEVLATLFDDIEREAKFGNVFIDMLLCNVKQDVYKQNTVEALEISDCIHKALQRYPFFEKQESLIHWDDNHDFSFMGSAELIEHVLLNLLKNALYQIEKVGKGEIFMWQTEELNFNILHLKDTATGMSEEIKESLFQQHMGDKSNRVGLGLAFCARVMHAMGGRIECHSLEGEFSEFLLYFPRIY